MTLKEMQERCGQASKEIRTMADLLEKEGRDFTPEEAEKWERINAEYDSLHDRVDKLLRAQKVTANRTVPEPGSEDRLSQLPDVANADAKRDKTESEEPWSFDLGGRHGQVRIERSNPAFARTAEAYGTSFRTYLRTGESRGLMVGDDSKGGYLAPMQMSTSLIKFLDDAVTMRQLGTVLTLGNAASIGVPSYDTDPADTDWTAEVPAADISEDAAIRFGKRELEPHLSTKLIKISQKMLRTSVLSVESLVTERIGYKFAITEEKAFLTGDGAQQPLGVFVASAQGISTTRNTTAASTSTFTADELVNTLYSLKPQYMQRATWLLHRDVLKTIRKLKDGNGQYLWVPGLQGNAADQILDRPFVLNENAPNTFTTGLYMLAVGDFSFYWIADSIGLEIQVLNELFQLRNQIGILGRKETDGMPVLEEAFARLILA